MSRRFHTGLLVLCACVIAFFSLLAAGDAFSMVLAAVGAGVLGLLCLWDYRVGLAALFLAMPVSQLGSHNTSSMKQALTGAVVALWFVWRLIKQEDHRRFLSEPFFGFVALFLAVTALSTVWAGNGLGFWVKNVLLLWSLLFVLKDAMKTPGASFLMVVLIIAAMVAEAAYGLIQFTADHTLMNSLFRVQGTTEHANIYGKFISMGLLYLTGLMIVLRGKAVRWLGAAAGLILVMGLVVSFSRNAMINLAVGLAFLIPMAYQWRIRKAVLIVLAVVYIGANALIVINIWPQSQERRAEEYEFSAMFRVAQDNYSILDLMKKRFQDGSGRDVIWQAARHAFYKQPVFGHGYRMGSQALMETIRWSYDDWTLRIGSVVEDGTFVPYGIHCHNMVLQILVEMGLAGLVLIGWFYYLAFRKSREQLTKPLPGLARMMVMLGTAYLIADLYFGLFESGHVFGFENTCYAFIFNTALVFWGASAEPPAPRPAPRPA
jgi:O-antigen ligase